MIKQINQQKTIQVLDDIICDMCGRSCCVYADMAKEIKMFPHLALESHWGYGSKKDCTYWKAQICEKCVDEKLTPLINFQIGNAVSVF